MEENLKNQLTEWANKYETPDFVKSDPVQFPRRFKLLQDIEVSAFITAWLAFGRREAIIEAAEQVHKYMGVSPYKYIMEKQYNDFMDCDALTLYRFYSWHDFYCLCDRLHDLYTAYNSMYMYMTAMLFTRKTSDNETFLRPLLDFFGECYGIPCTLTSSCKRLCMFLRWMIRVDSPVDLGLWLNFNPKKLIMPVDTHVHQVALELGIISRKSNDFIAAVEITKAMSEVFRNDPARGDFAMFGYGVNHPAKKGGAK